MRLEVIGLPAPQGSKTGFYNPKIKRIQMTDGAKNSRGRVALDSWREAVADVCRRDLERRPRPPMQGPLALTISFRFPPTKTDPYRYWHAVKPDLDKLARSTFDALKLGGMISDDCVISKLSTTKRYIVGTESTGATIDIENLATEEAGIRERRKEQAARERRRAPAADNQERLLA